MKPLDCPACAIALAERRAGRVLAFRCERCEGVAVTLAGLRSRHEGAALVEIWRRASLPTNARGCPACRAQMRVADVPIAGEGPLELDLCKRCQLVWFDRDELARLPLRPGAPPNVDAADAPSTRRLHPTTRRVARIASARPTVDAGDLGCVIIELAIDAALAILG